MLRSGQVCLLILIGSLTLAACGGGSSHNDPPAASDLSITTTEDTPVQGTFVGSDPNQDALVAELVASPTKGDVQISSPNGLSFTYVPRANQNGADTFTYRVSDGRARSSPATVTVSITAVNDAPTIAPSVTVDEDQSFSSQLVVEPDGETFTAQIITPPAHGTLQQEATPGRFTYTPAPDFNGSDSFGLQAVDATSTESTQTVAVTVRPVNDAPLASDDHGHTVQDRSVRLVVLTNDTDIDGDSLTVTVSNPPAVGSAAVNTDGSIQYTPTNSFVGNTTLQYQVRDSTGATSTASVSIGVGLTYGIVYSGPGGLHFTDGARTFAVGAPLRAGESILEIRAATEAPVLLYMTNLNTVRHLFRVDLRQPGVAQEVDQPLAFPGIQEFTIDASGSRVAYHFGGHLQFIDFTNPSIIRDLGDGQRSLFMNPSGTRVFYAGQITAPYQTSGALFAVSTSGLSLPQQITPTVTAPDSTSGVIYLTRDEHRIYYSVSMSSGDEVIMAVDPDNLGSEFVVQGPTPGGQLGWDGITSDETAFWYRSLAAREDYYLVRISSPGAPAAPINLTSGTANGQISARTLSPDGAHFYYTRSNNSGVASRLYRVDTSAPAISTPISAVDATYFGVSSFSLASDGSNGLYTTLDRVPLGGGLSAGSADIFFLDTATGSITLVHHFDGAATVGAYAPDNSFAILDAAEQVGGIAHAYVLNLRDRTQLISIDGGGAIIVPNF